MPEHDEWIRDGLRDATFALQVVPAGKGSAQWGSVEELPVDVYHCDFFKYDPPEDFPRHDVCCIRTGAAWWIIFTESMHACLQERAQAGELIQSLHQTIARINERQIGAWLLVRDQGMSGEQALAEMDRYLAERDEAAYADIQTLFFPSEALSENAIEFEDDDYGSEPLDLGSLDGDILAFGRDLDDRDDLFLRSTRLAA